MPWRIETRSISVVPEAVTQVKQVHGGDIVWAEDIERTTTADGIAAPFNFTKSFMVRTADCLPLVLTSAEVACALHVSRKSLMAGLLDHVPDFLAPSAITHVSIGPHICAEHFAFEWMGPEIKECKQKFPFACRTSQAGLHLSLKKVVEKYIQQWSVAPESVVFDGRCTFEVDTLPSYRRALRDKQPLSDHLATIVTSII